MFHSYRCVESILSKFFSSTVWLLPTMTHSLLISRLLYFGEKINTLSRVNPKLKHYFEPGNIFRHSLLLKKHCDFAEETNTISAIDTDQNLHLTLRILPLCSTKVTTSNRASWLHTTDFHERFALTTVDWIFPKLCSRNYFRWPRSTAKVFFFHFYGKNVMHRLSY